MFYSTMYEHSRPIHILTRSESPRVKIGEGTYGKIYKQDGHAIKRMRKKKLYYYINEIAILKRCHHENIIELLGIYEHKDKIELVLPLAMGDLKSITLNPAQRIAFPTQLLRAVEYMADRNLSHRDIKLQNILVMTPDRICLCDFSWGCDFVCRVSTSSTTLCYKSPEALLGDTKATHDYYTRLDVWSCGCSIYEMLTGNVLFPGDSQIDQIFRIFRITGTPDDPYWSQLPEWNPRFPKWKPNITALEIEPYGTVIALCLTLNPYDRPSAKDLIKLSGSESQTASKITRLCYMTNFDLEYIRCRKILFIWMFEIVLDLNLHLRVLHLAFWILDTSSIKYTTNDLQCYGCAAIHIASEYCNTYESPELSDLEFLSDGSCTQAQIKASAKRLLKKLEYDLQQTLRYDMIDDQMRPHKNLCIILFTIIYCYLPESQISDILEMVTQYKSGLKPNIVLKPKVNTIRKYINNMSNYIGKKILTRFDVDIKSDIDAIYKL